MQAFRTDDSPEVDDMLVRLGNTGGALPFYAVFPADNPNKPILLDGLLTSPKPIIDALKRAGPSRGVIKRARSAAFGRSGGEKTPENRLNAARQTDSAAK